MAVTKVDGVYIEGSKKLVWFSKEQMQQLDDIQEITGESNGMVVRQAMKLYLEKLLANQGK